MFEVKGDLWQLPADVICITTNGTIKKNGEAVMGRGCAKQAADRYPNLPQDLGLLIKNVGNVFNYIGKYDDRHIYSFPVKHNWWEKADINLIVASATELRKAIVELKEIYESEFVALPRPGCGNGQLEWAEVKEAIKDIIPDNVGVVHPAN